MPQRGKEMSLFTAALLAFGMVDVVAAGMDFINPPPFGAVGDFSSNPVYTIGKTLRVQWNNPPTDAGISLLLYQMNGTNYLLPGQYLFQNEINTTSYDWVVAVSSSLPETLERSNLFYLSLFQEGSSTSDSNSHYFNITNPQTTTTSTGISTTATKTATLTTSSGSAAPVTITPATSPSPSTSGGLTEAAKIGIGIGVPIAAIIAIGAGWLFFFRRYRRGRLGLGGVQKNGAHGYNGEMAPWGDYRANQYKDHDPNAVFEASGDSRVIAPVELDGGLPPPR